MYYEEYEDGDYGYYFIDPDGSGTQAGQVTVNTLRNDPVLASGYGYLAASIFNNSITITIGEKTYSVASDKAVKSTGVDISQKAISRDGKNMSAAGISKRSKELSAKYAVEQDAAQNGGGTTQGTVEVDGQSVTVIYTGSGDELTSYRVAKGG